MATENIASVEPPQSRPAGNPPDPGPTVPQKPSFFPGWPRVRCHPVYGCRTFDTPNDYAAVGGDDERGDWRFKSASEADAARTETEAQLAMRANMDRKMAAVGTSGEGTVVSQSVQAHESARTGYPEPGVVLPEEDRARLAEVQAQRGTAPPA